MGLLRKLRSRLAGSNTAENSAPEEAALRERFLARCRHFRSLLSANRAALEIMADMEAKLGGALPFSLAYVRLASEEVGASVYKMIRDLSGISADAYAALYERHGGIAGEISALVASREALFSGPLVVPVEESGRLGSHECGEKMARLGELAGLDLEIPDGFVATAAGFHRFLQANNLREEIDRRIQEADASRLDAVFALSSSLQKLILDAPLPEDLESEILRHYAMLKERHGPVRLAVRSSAVGEDGLAHSFAGQYRSELNVAEDMLISAYKDVLAGKYSVTAMAYRFNRGITDDAVPMCVGFLRMVDAAAGGVAYTRDPLDAAPKIVINASPGLPQAIVDGRSPSFDVFEASKDAEPRLLSSRVPLKTSKLVCAPEEGLQLLELDPEEGARPCLTEEQITLLAATALKLEAFYDLPQDVEWAFDSGGRLIILQSRPLPEAKGQRADAPAPDGAKVLLQGGLAASLGRGGGKVCVMRRDADMLRCAKGAVLVADKAHSRWAPVLAQASALVTQSGGSAGHLATVAREYGVPALFGLEGALDLLPDGAEVTVDADAGRVYAGLQGALLERDSRQPENPMRGSPVYKILEEAVRHIVPLNLLDPAAPEFAPEHCRTLHDITRFCHEKAVQAMFSQDGAPMPERAGKRLRYKKSKLQYWVVDLDDGFKRPIPGDVVDFEDIASAPMLALWEGMGALPWAGPPTAGGGFLSVVVQSAANPELEVTARSSLMNRNYFLISKDYCNLQARFGYHFCTVEGQAGEVAAENYLNFYFKGGAADLPRRLLRVRLVEDLLADHGFVAYSREDSLAARTEDLPRERALELFKLLGFLLVHTRQLDAAMSGQAAVEHYRGALEKGIAELKIGE